MADASTKLGALAAVEKGDGIAETCRRLGIHRATYYRWKARRDRGGVAALEDKPPVAASCPHKTPEDVAAMVLALSAAHPAWGCKRLERYLALDGYGISSPTIQRILTRAGIGRRSQRWRHLCAGAAEGGNLTREQIAFLENPD